MKEICPKIECCRFLKSCDDTVGIIKESWLNLFCRDSHKYHTCARLKYIEDNNDIPPDALMPTGSIIE